MAKSYAIIEGSAGTVYDGKWILERPSGYNSVFNLREGAVERIALETKMPGCKFQFDGDGEKFDGFAHGSTWNGFDNVAVTKETIEKLIAQSKEIGEDAFREIEPMENGLYSLGFGFATVICEARSPWRELCNAKAGCIGEGDVVIFETDFDIFPHCIVKAGTVCTVEENGLNEIWATISLCPHKAIPELEHWEGRIYLYLPEGCNLPPEDSRIYDFAKADDEWPCPVRLAPETDDKGSN